MRNAEKMLLTRGLMMMMMMKAMKMIFLSNASPKVQQNQGKCREKGKKITPNLSSLSNSMLKLDLVSALSQLNRLIKCLESKDRTKQANYD